MNPRQFEEIQLIGKKKVIRHTEAKQFPELLFIHDLVFNFSEMADEVSQQQYETIRDK
jgi:hypothetical protein